MISTRKNSTRMLRTLLLSVASATVLHGETQAQSHLPIEERDAAIECVASRVEEGYVFSEIGQKMAEDIRRRAEQGEYGATDGPQLATLLTQHLRAISSDLHLNVHYSPQKLPAITPRGEPDSIQLARFQADLLRDNYWFRWLEILPGNIGYIRLDLFAPPEFAAETYDMSFVFGTDALIIDLRQNGGSLSPDDIPMFATWFFERPTHLIDLKSTTPD